MSLTDAAARAAKPRDKPYKLADAQGLYLLVNSKGRYWRLDYRFAGKRLTLALGVYPEVSLAKAREARGEAREQLRKGIDPGLSRKVAKAMPAGGDGSFEAIGREWFANNTEAANTRKWATSHSEKVLLRLESDLYPWIGSRIPDTITAMELLAIARRIVARGAVETAHRVMQYASSIFRYAIVTGRATRNPVPDLKGAIPAAERGHFASIKEPAKIGGLLRAIESYPGSFVVTCALRLAPLVFVRPSELRLMEWAEIENGQWRIPKAKMKMREQHLVPLSDQALKIIGEIKPLTGTGRYVFSTRPGRSLSDGALRMALKSLGYDGSEQTVHGFRSMASTLLNEQGFNPDHIERQLAHSDDSTRGDYNYAQWLPERRKMMQAWADYLDTLKQSSVTA